MNNRDNIFRRQHGAALLVALMIIALASFIALQMIQRLELDLARSSAVSRNFSAAEYARGLEFMARRQLRDDETEQPRVDTWQDRWAAPLPALPVPGGAVSGRMIDLSGRFNLNSLLVNQGQIDETQVDMLRRLLRILNLEPALAERIADWLDSDSLPRPNGAEAAAYASLQPPYRPANRSLADISELRLISGIDDAVFRRLSPHVSTLPVAAGNAVNPGQSANPIAGNTPRNLTRINVNTATIEVLMALDPAISRDRAQRLHNNGSANYQTVDAFLNHPALTGLQLPQLRPLISVRSSHFLATAVVVLDQVPRRYDILLERSGNSYHVRQRRYGAPYGSVDSGVEN
ncbi:MAG: type II secretion system minor pseudopilin GspK [Wenzhouxiangellaceae bacterium]